jgi:hypothetical protein
MLAASSSLPPELNGKLPRLAMVFSVFSTFTLSLYFELFHCHALCMHGFPNREFPSAGGVSPCHQTCVDFESVSHRPYLYCLYISFSIVLFRLEAQFLLIKKREGNNTLVRSEVRRMLFFREFKILLGNSGCVEYEMKRGQRYLPCLNPVEFANLLRLRGTG